MDDGTNKCAAWLLNKINVRKCFEKFSSQTNTEHNLLWFHINRSKFHCYYGLAFTLISLDQFRTLSLFNTLRIKINIISSNQKYPMEIAFICMYYLILVINDNYGCCSNTICSITNNESMRYCQLHICNFAFNKFE